MFRIHAYPPPGNEPWRISIIGYVEEGRMGMIRSRVAEFFYDRNLYSLGSLFHEGAKGFFAVGPEMGKRKVAGPLRPRTKC
jgi:hypothetical protein